MSSFEAIVYVAAHQFYLQDSATSWGGSYSNDPWATPGDGPGVAPGVVGLQTSRGAGHAPVFVEVLDGPPGDGPPGDAPTVYHKVVEASIDVPSGCLRVLGEDNDESSPPLEVKVAPGRYGVRVLYAGLDTVTYDDDDGAEHYVVQLFTGASPEARVVRAYEGADDDPVRTSDDDRDTLEPALLAEVRSKASTPSARALAVVQLARLGAIDAVVEVGRSDSSRAMRLHAVNALRLVQSREGLEAFEASDDRAIRASVQRAIERL